MAKWNIIGRGKAGWHASGGNEWSNVSISGGTDPLKYAQEADEGCLVYDADKADMNAFASEVIRGPMCDATLAPGTVVRFREREALARMAPALEGGFQTIALLALADYSSLDSIAPDLYVERLRAKVPGVRFGVVVFDPEMGRNTIAWEAACAEHHPSTPCAEERFVCEGCARDVCAHVSADDDMRDYCDDCWAAAQEK